MVITPRTANRSQVFTASPVKYKFHRVSSISKDEQPSLTTLVDAGAVKEIAEKDRLPDRTLSSKTTGERTLMERQ